MLSIENIISLIITLCQLAISLVQPGKMNNSDQWLPLDVAAQKYGYAHKESLTRRLRQLRRRGLVADFGRPPADYPTQETMQRAVIFLMWPNPKTALLRADAPFNLLKSERGKRAKPKQDN